MATHSKRRNSVIANNYTFYTDAQVGLGVATLLHETPPHTTFVWWEMAYGDMVALLPLHAVWLGVPRALVLLSS